MALLFVDEGKFDKANTHIEHAKSHAVNHLYHMGRAISLQARIWHEQQRYEEAISEALDAL